ncbi:unnamed protein product, partial [Rodentolepis nana]|uniref:Protein RIC1 homolog n=1 Tax=Rodentolepis nana TaxID=102285 RepID=A0A0R3T2A7_RODNA
EQAFEVHAGLTWWGRFICFCAFSYAVNHCEIRCYPCTEKLDDRFASILPLDNSIRPLILDVVRNRLIIFSTDSHYRSFTLTCGSKPHEVTMTPHSTYNLSAFFPYAACLTRIFPFSLYSNSPIVKHNSAGEVNTSRRRNSADLEDTTLLATYAGNLLLLPNLHSTSLTQPQDENGSSIAGFLGFGFKKDTNARKYRDTFSPTLIASQVELLWYPSTYIPLPSPPQRPTEFIEAGSSDSESEEDQEISEVHLSSDPKEGRGEMNSSLTPSLLSKSIWLFCGADGVRIWLPLDTSMGKRSSIGESSISSSPTMERKLQSGVGSYSSTLVHSTKASRRVMISLGLDGLSYPLDYIEAMHFCIDVKVRTKDIPSLLIFVLFSFAVHGAFNIIFLDKAVLVTVQTDYLRTERSYSDVLSDPFIQMPFCCVNFKTNLFLPHLLKDLLRKNLSDVAFELASSYRHLPYFQHILELLLHEVLEEEATSKFPIPDPLLPQVTAFIEQFPHFLDVVVQCTRKTEVTWWRHLFCSLGRRPKDVFDHALSLEQLDTAASCLVILQNSESHSTCKQCALILLETAIRECQWHLVRDLVRFLKATTLSYKCTDDALNEVDAFFEHVKCRFIREGSWKSLEEIFANLPSLPSNGTDVQNDLMESSDLQNSPLPHWLLANREHVAIVDDWPRCFQRLHSDFGMFLPLPIQKEGVSINRQKRPGFAKAVNIDKPKSSLNLDISPSVWHCNLNYEAPTFHQALRTQKQLQVLLGHLLLVLRELKPSSEPDVFTPPEISLFSWAFLIAFLQLDKQAIFAIFSFMQSRCETKISSESSIASINQFLNGLESLESLIATNPRANPEYFSFFVELKPRIRKFVQYFVEPKPVVAELEEKPALNLQNGSILEESNTLASKASPENHIFMSMSMQTMKTQNHVAADFESASDEHLVHPGLDEEGSRSSCIVS